MSDNWERIERRVGKLVDFCRENLVAKDEGKFMLSLSMVELCSTGMKLAFIRNLLDGRTPEEAVEYMMEDFGVRLRKKGAKEYLVGEMEAFARLK